MVTLYLSVFEFRAKDKSMTVEDLKEYISPVIDILSNLQGCFGQDSIVIQPIEYIVPRIRCIVSTSIGKQKADHFLQLSECLANLFANYLPDCKVIYDSDRFNPDAPKAEI